MGTHPGRIARFSALGVVAACASLLVAACGSSGGSPAVTHVIVSPGTASAVASPTPVPATPTPAPVTPTISPVTYSSAAPDGSWTITFVKPQVSGVPSAAAMNTAIDARVNGLINAFVGPGLPPVSPGDGASTLDGKYTVAYLSPSIVSLRFEVDTYFTGAAGVDRKLGSINLTVSTGVAIGLPDLFTTPTAAVLVLSAQCQTRLAADLGTDLFWPASPTMATFETAWVFTAPGLEFGWNKYDVGPGAVGTPYCTIPWTEPTLAAVISPTGPAAQFLP
jgi:hypothetical protein